MKNVKMTTFERGLIVRIDLTNLDTRNYLEIDYLHIQIETTYEEKDSKDSDYIELSNIEIKPSSSISFWHNVEFRSYLGERLGKWSVRVAYGTSKNVWSFNNKIEPYSFEFKLVSEGELQKAIEENPSGFVFSPTIVIEFSVLSIAVTSFAVYLLARKKRR